MLKNRPTRLDLSGQRFGRLIAQKYLGMTNSKSRWECLCDCGTVISVATGNLTAKNRPTQSCGCLQREVSSNLCINRTLTPQENLSGQRFGRLRIEKYLGTTATGYRRSRRFWQAICDCGNTIEIDTTKLNRSTRPARSCGCLQKEAARANGLINAAQPRKNLIGNRYGQLTVVSFAGVCPNSIDSVNRRLNWRCKCDCGKFIDIRASSLTAKYPPKSCGCLDIKRGPAKRPPEIKVKQPKIPSPVREQPEKNQILAEQASTDLAWLEPQYLDIWRRCNDPEHKAYHSFGGVGVSIDWSNFDLFCAWISAKLPPPTQDSRLLRISRYGNFCPGNLRWAS